MTEIGVEQFERGLRLQIIREFLAHGDERSSAAWCHVHSAQQLLPRRFSAIRERRRRLGRGCCEISLGRLREACRVWLKVVGKEAEQGTALLRCERCEHIKQLPS